MRFQKITEIVISIAVIVLICGCGTLNIVVRPNSYFNRGSRLTVLSEGNDTIGIQGKLEHLLLSHGFNLVSEAVASEKIKYQDEIKSEAPGQSKAEASLQRVTEVKSEYVLKFNYNAYWDLPGWCFANFSVSVVELDTGNVVVSVDFSGGRSVSSVLEDFVNKLDKSMAKK